MTQLCLTIPALSPPEGVRLLSDALAVAKIAAVIIVPVDAGGAIAPAAALPIIAAAQKAGAAVLIHGDAHLARTLKADGVHLPWSLDVRALAEDAREILGQGGIVGAEAGTSRHSAMELGEFGVDYVAFASALQSDGGETGDVRHDLVSWWADIFEVPVVALGVLGSDDAVALAEAQAEFVGVTLPVGEDAVARLAEIAAALGATAPKAA
jgi:thiamine-phosphate pyrophosphorylase